MKTMNQIEKMREDIAEGLTAIFKRGEQHYFDIFNVCEKSCMLPYAAMYYDILDEEYYQNSFDIAYADLWRNVNDPVAVKLLNRLWKYCPYQE